MPTVPRQDLSQGPSTRGCQTAATLPPSPAPLGITRRTAKGLEVAPQRWLGAGGGWAPNPGLCRSAPCQPGWGASPKRGPPRPLPGEALAASAGTGTSPGGRLPPGTSGKGTIPGHFFFGRPRVPPPSAPPVLLPRSGAGIQLNQCSANNLLANKTFSSLSLLPPTPPQSVCDGSALI